MSIFLLHDEHALGAGILVLSIEGADKVGIVLVKAMQTAHCAAAVGSYTDYAFPASSHAERTAVNPPGSKPFPVRGNVSAPAEVYMILRCIAPIRTKLPECFL